jgi:hypothetical protein
MASLFVPMLVLPSRQESVYWYIPMIGLSMAVAAIATRVPRQAVVLFFVFWLPLNYAMLRERRREILSIADEHRWYMAGLLDFARRVPPLKAVVYEATPPHVGSWGVEGGIHLAFGHNVDTVWYRNPRAPQLMAEVPMALVNYYTPSHQVKGLLRTRDELQSYIRFSDGIVRSQFGEGWSGYEDGPRRSIASQAEVTLYRPPESKTFEIVASGPAEIAVFEDGHALGARRVPDSSVRNVRWDLDGAAAGNRKITIESRDHTTAIDALGYVSP